MSRPLTELRDLRPERVCIIKPSALGDIVNALPVLSSLRDLWPEAKFSWVVNRSLRGLVEGHPDLEEVILYDRTKGGLSLKGIRGFLGFLKQLRSRQFDVTIDLQGLLRSGIMTAATGAKYRVGRGDSREGADWFYTHQVPTPGEDSHAVDRLLSVAEAFGGDISAPRYVVPMTEADRQWARDLMASVPRPRLVLNMGARWETKRWPPRHFAEIARRAHATRGAGIVLIGAPEDRVWVEEFLDLYKESPVVDICGRTTLPQLAALASESDLVVSNDTGPLHLSTAAGARVVGIYTCTSPQLNGPYGPKAMAVSTCVWCAAKYITRCERLECFDELTPDRVWTAVEIQLDAEKPAKGAAA